MLRIVGWLTTRPKAIAAEIRRRNFCIAQAQINCSDSKVENSATDIRIHGGHLYEAINEGEADTLHRFRFRWSVFSDNFQNNYTNLSSESYFTVLN